jgi:hypothetical protein
MNHLIKMLVADIAKNESNFNTYHSLRENAGWKMHLQYLEKLRLLMSVDMLGEEYTNLSSEEKDIRQRTYAGVNIVLNFLVNPFERLEKKAKFKAVEKKQQQQNAAFKPHKGATFGKT